MEVLAVLIVVAILVAIVTVIGHVMWLMLAAIGRWLTGGEQARSDSSTWSSASSPSKDPTQQIRDDLKAANRLVGYATFRGWLNATQIESLKNLLAAFSERQAAEQLKSSQAEFAPTTRQAGHSLDQSRMTPELPPISLEEPIQADLAQGTQAAEFPNQFHEALPANIHHVPPTQTPLVVNASIPTEPTTSVLKRAVAISTVPAMVHPLDAPVDEESNSSAKSVLKVGPGNSQAKPLGAELLRTFMEKSNIRWVEIVSATLIVVCSVGLVISLWNTLSATSRYFPSLVFLLATIAVHGAGQYTLRQWKLRSTSRGILHIGLMLIPLAVLVGILLSRRPDQSPQLDVGTIAVLAIGTAIYGALAVTASRALFSSRWLPVATAVIIGSITLVPIHFLASKGQLLRQPAALSLLPLIFISLFNVLQLSSFATLPVLSTGRMRRIASQVLQIIFAALVPCTFWVMQSQGAGLSKASIAAAGMLFAGWASWGWTASLKRLVAGYEVDAAIPRRVSKSSSGMSWYIVVAWCLAGVCSLALIAILWQAMDNRAMLVVSLLGLAGWWYVHGLRCGLLTSLFVATISAILSLSIFVEGFLPEAQSLLVMSDWLSLPRVGLLTAVSLAVGVAGLAMAKLQPQSLGLKTALTTAGGLKASLPKLAVAIIAAASAVLLATVGLTTLASLTPLSQPAYGGNWAPLLLLGYGSLLLGAGICRPQATLVASRSTNIDWLLKSLVPIGQLVLLLATFKLCHSAPWAPQWLIDLRPIRAWAIGTGGLAVIWAALGATLRWTSQKQSLTHSLVDSPSAVHSWKHEYSTHLLVLGAIGLSIISALAYWSRGDKLVLASSAGWTLPVVLSLGFMALRQSMLRELAVLAISGWVLSLVTSVGWHYDWWNQLGLAATVSVLALSQLVILTAYQLLMGKESDSETDWKRAGLRWSSDLLLNISWLFSLLSAAIPMMIQMYFNLNGGQLTEKFFVSAPLTPMRSMFVMIALLGLGLFTFLSRSSSASTLRTWLAALPLALAALAGCQMSTPYGVPTLLWIVAAVLISLELLPLTKATWGKQLAELDQLVVGRKSIQHLPGFWLRITHLFSLASMIVVSVGVLLNYWWHGLPEPLSPLVANMQSWSGWGNNLARVSLWMGPLTVVLAVRWLHSLYTAAPSAWVVERGYSLGALVGLACTFAGAPDIETTVLFGAQSFSLVMLLISAKTLGFTTLRNWLGLRQLDRQSSARQVLSKACRGSRWREAHKSAWRLWLGSIIPSILLCILAGGLVAIYPRQALPELHAVGGVWTIGTVLFALGMWWVLGTDESLPKFGLLAITLSLLSPILSAGYASWLMNHPASALTAAGNYEPYRLQIGMWLASLLIGLTIRIYCTMHSKSMSRPVEACWMLLAVLVGVLSILGISDANWATIQLVLLAAIIAISCEASGQTWRGYVSAAVGVLAWSPWCVKGLRDYGIFYGWQSLIAVVGVAMLALLARYAFRFKQVEVRQQSVWTIDRTVVLGVSVVSVLLSGLWVLLEPLVVPVSSWVLWSVLGMVGLTWVLAATRLLEVHSCHRGLGVYVATIALTLVVAEFVCSHFHVARIYSQLAWWSGLLGSMAALAVLLREITLQRFPLQKFLQSRNLADPAKLASTAAWMAVWHTLVALCCLVPSVWLVLTMNQEGLRMAAIALPLLGAAAILPLSFDRLRTFQRGSVLLLVSATLVLAWWADLPSAWALREPNESWLFVQRAFLAFVFLSVLYPIIAYFRKQGDQWISTLGKGGWICLGLATATGVGLVLGSASGHWEDYPNEVSLVAKLLTSVGWAVVFGRLLQFAAWPQGIDRAANTTLRTAAVYGAEVAIALGCAATYYHFPDLFNKGRFVNWWPVILFGIAFASTLLGEWLKRIELPLLADPIRRSSLLLPIIPLAGVWAFHPERATLLWNEFDRFALLLVIGSSLYGLHGWVRGSVGLRALSAALALFGFWSFLHGHPDMRFFEHPQFWLLPPAIGALIFVEWNRSRLDSSVVTAVRYLSILVAYFSSTSEVFFRSFEGNLWPPIFLLFLALCGVVAGIVLRVRAFLFCGVVFVMIALFGMVWHAAQAIDQVWPWWAFGIVTGISLIVMLGYFEKNRPKILKYLEDLKQWET